VAASGWAKIVRNTAATMSLWDLGTSANKLRAKCTRQRWWLAPCRMRRSAATRRTAVLVGDHQLDAVEAAFIQGAQEAAPEHLIFGIARIDAQHFPAAGGGDSSGDHDSHAGYLPAGAGAAHMQVGGVEEQIRKRGVVQRPATKRRHGLIQPSTETASATSLSQRSARSGH
jgi:hypothetical protein